MFFLKGVHIMGSKNKELVRTEHQYMKLQDLQKRLQDFYEEGDGKELKGKPLTQTYLAEKLYMNQSEISRTLRGYEIDWNTGRITKKAPTNNLIELTKDVTIVKPSTFFLTVSRTKRNKLKNALMLYFPSTKTKYGIIHIIEITSPSGLLVFSDDHNLDHLLSDNEYLKKIVDDYNTNIE